MEDGLLEEVSELFKSKGLTLGSAESFTGGSFASLITSISGASKFFKGAYVTYASEEKIKLLGVPEYEVKMHGVVSREIAFYMANNARQLLNTDFCVSFTGNAGPDAMEGKPVGEVHIGIAFNGTAQIYSLRFEGSRKEIQDQSMEFALKKLLQVIKG